jgi:iron complex outermembrane receptor protein
MLDVALASVASAQAAAQPASQQASNADAAAGGQLAEVVVTAEKRTTNVQRTPIAIATASADDLERSGALKLTDLEKSIPDVIIAPQGPAVTLMIRGVYSTDTSPGSENADSINLNGAYLPKTQAIGGMLFDVQRIEVAEGPQGTLYGRNANGGAINIITNKPVIGEDSATGTAEYGSYELVHADGALNLAVGDTLALRVAFHTLSHQGYFTGGLEDADEKGARGTVMWQPSRNESLWLTLDAVTLGGAGSGNTIVRATPGSKYYVPSNPWDDSFFTTVVNPADPAGTTAPTSRNNVQKVDSQNDGLTAENDYDFGPALWTTEFSWRKFDGHSITINNLASWLDPATGYLRSGHNYNPQHFDAQSLETRLSSTAATPLQWVAGLYAYHIQDGGDMISYANLTTQVPSVQISNGFDEGKLDYENAWSYAAFGQLTWTIANLHLTAGGRYTIDQKHDEGIYTQFGASPPGSPGYQAAPAVSHTWNKFTWKLGVSYDLAPANMVYANVATGYEAGGYSYGPGVDPAVGPIYAPETITAYEIGSKNRFLHDTLQANFAAWIYKYKDYQTNLALFLNSGAVPLPVLTTTSAGQATYKGVSADFVWALTPDDRFNLSASLLNARYGTYVAEPAPGYTTIPGVPDAPEVFTGTPVTTVPAAVGNVAYDHIFQLPHGSLDWQLSANAKGTTLLAISAEAGYGNVRAYQPAFAIENTSIRYTAESGKWNITAYVDNIGNEVKIRSGGITSTNGFGGYYEDASFFSPRIVGVIFQASIK